MDTPSVLYIRELPGGGFVAIEGLPGEGHGYRGMLMVERRSDAGRRLGHIPPVVVQTEGHTQGSVFRELLPIADSNVAVATAIRRWQASRAANAWPEESGSV
ncbi:MAG TPA: hypothetical protein VFY16_07875 [Gemmatimonadaceae bacterium]|nr:hypothetical protein [Gemmatimonadaceae bacterium]